MKHNILFPAFKMVKGRQVYSPARPIVIQTGSSRLQESDFQLSPGQVCFTIQQQQKN